MIKYFTLLLFVFFQFTYFNSYAQDNTYKITVRAEGFPDSLMVKLFDRDRDKTIDSAYVISQQFVFKGEVGIPALCYLFFYNHKGERVRPFIYTYFYLEPGHINISGTYDDFRNSIITGSPQTGLQKQYEEIRKNLKDQYESVYGENNFSSDTVIENKYKKELQDQRLEFLFSNANQQLSIHKLLYLRKDISKDSLMLFYNKLDSINKNSIKGVELYKFAKSEDIKVGDNYSDIWGYDLKDKKIRLSDYEGKVILLDFWATGCKPCHIQNRTEFQELYKKYDQKDFVLISYSLDTKRSNWEKSSEKDGISWINLSDLQGFKSDNIKKYAVQAIPNSFLINKNGVVVQTFTGYLPEQEKIEQVINALIKEPATKRTTDGKSKN